MRTAGFCPPCVVTSPTPSTFITALANKQMTADAKAKGVGEGTVHEDDRPLTGPALADTEPHALRGGDVAHGLVT